MLTAVDPAVGFDVHRLSLRNRMRDYRHTDSQCTEQQLGDPSNPQRGRRESMKTENNGQVTAHPRKEQPPIPRRVLLVEDDEDARDKLQRLLQSDQNLQIDAVEDGEQALKAINDMPYSLVITDLRMPGFDGMDLIREVQKRM